MKKIVLSLVLLLLCITSSVYAQTETVSETQDTKRSVLRPDNMISAAVGSSVANADLPEAKFDLNLVIGYKRHVSPNFRVGLEYNKFNIVFQDIYNEGFMSFDLNLEYLLFPDKKFSPFVFAGPGMNAANGLENSSFKFQAGGGLEYMVSNNIGLKLMFDRSFLSDDLLDGVEAGGGNDAYYRVSVGTNIYFPLNRKRVKNDDDPSFIKANPIEY